MKTTVNNILNRKETSLFVNNFDPKYNLISHIICQRKQTSYLLNKGFRKNLESELSIIEKKSINGEKIAFCLELDLISRQILN
tara:strand:- start:54 stop:302 length:249 start_codon:yes stop_codon:yes gene_type:complete